MPAELTPVLPPDARAGLTMGDLNDYALAYHNYVRSATDPKADVPALRDRYHALYAEMQERIARLVAVAQRGADVTEGEVRAVFMAANQYDRSAERYRSDRNHETSGAHASIATTLRTLGGKLAARAASPIPERPSRD